MIRITFTNGNTNIWKREEYTDYRYNGKCFIVMKGRKQVGIYNIDSIVSVVIN